METKNARQTQKMAIDLIKKIPLKREKAFVIALKGDLGSGKTTFVQGLVKGLGLKEKITSPTFVIFKKYNNFYHFDCYRIDKRKEILELGFKEIVSNAQNIVAIEWAERIKSILPKNTCWITFKFISENKREVNVVE